MIAHIKEMIERVNGMSKIDRLQRLAQLATKQQINPGVDFNSIMESIEMQLIQTIRDGNGELIEQKKELEILNAMQHTAITHPYTCDRRSENCEVRDRDGDYSKDGVLIATDKGWVCPCGDYTQEIK